MHQYDRGRGAYFTKLLLLPRVRTRCAENWFHRIRQQRIGVTLREIIDPVDYCAFRTRRRLGFHLQCPVIASGDRRRR